MKLRSKVTIILLAVWIVIIVVANVGSYLILSKGYFKLEQEQAADNLHRIHETINEMNTAINKMAATWAIWDDTYNFVNGSNTNYIKQNIVVSAFTAADIDLMIFYNSKGKSVYSDALNHTNDGLVSVPVQILSVLSPNGKFAYQPKINHSFQGMVSLNNDIYLLASQPIVTSHNKGPVHGALVFGRRLSDDAIKKIKEITKINFSIISINDINNGRIHINKLGEILNGKNIVNLNNKSTMTGYSALKDINGHPIAVISAIMPREIYQYGMKTISFFNTVILAYSIIMLCILWYLLQVLLVKRLELLRTYISNIDSYNNSVDGIILGAKDEVSTVAALYHQATHDPLTGLANRNLLEQVFKKYVKSIDSEKLTIALLFMDIDHFKRVNDTLGHEIGDLVLVEIANRISSCLRSNDLAVRLGGDEFLVMLVDIDVEQIQFIVERIYSSLSKPAQIKNHELHISASMGISIFPRDGHNISTLLKNADIALYYSKENGRNYYQYYSDKLNQDIQDAYRKESELQRAIDNNELLLHYQPIYDVLTQKIIEIETFVRWKHPTRGLLNANEFIPLAEKSGLIHPIGKWVLVNACRQVKSWQQQGVPVVPISVNLSVIQTKGTSIYRLVMDVLNHTGLDSKLLELELTESSYLDVGENILHDMRLLKESGVNLIVDDFGAGYSGMAHLRKLPISKLKIDHSFIQESDKNSDETAITLAIVALAHQLDLLVIAEGVETKEQFRFLRVNNMDAAQGEYLSAPLDADSCAALLSSTQMVIPS